MKNKLLVIFLFAIISIYSIYNFSLKTNYTLDLGNYDNYTLRKNSIHNKYDNVSYFLYEKITYKELIKSIQSNDYMIKKWRKIYLQQLINKSNFIVIDIGDNDEYYLKELKILINRISYSKLIIVGKNSQNEKIT